MLMIITTVSTSSIETIDDIENNLSNYIGSLSDGQLIYDSLRKSLYIYTNGILVQLTNPTVQKIAFCHT